MPSIIFGTKTHHLFYFTLYSTICTLLLHILLLQSLWYKLIFVSSVYKTFFQKCGIADNAKIIISKLIFLFCFVSSTKVLNYIYVKAEEILRTYIIKVAIISLWGGSSQSLFQWGHGLVVENVIKPECFQVWHLGFSSRTAHHFTALKQVKLSG